jgi:hypothetical protein
MPPLTSCPSSFPSPIPLPSPLPPTRSPGPIFNETQRPKAHVTTPTRMRYCESSMLYSGFVWALVGRFECVGLWVSSIVTCPSHSRTLLVREFDQRLRHVASPVRASSGIYLREARFIEHAVSGEGLDYHLSFSVWSSHFLNSGKQSGFI